MRKLRFLFSSLFVVLTCAFFNISASAATYDVGTDTEWQEMIIAVNAMDDTSDVVINLTADIDLSNLSSYTTNTNITSIFRGEFNGNNFCISNVTVSVSSNSSSGNSGLGLINNCSGAYIHNLVVKNITYKNSDSSLHAAGIIGHANSASKLSYIYCLSSDIQLDYFPVYFGSVCGSYSLGSSYVASSYIYHLYNFADLNVPALSGDCYIGGILGYCSFSNGSLSFFANYGDISCISVSSSYISGLVGYAYNSFSSFKSCYNLGNFYGYVINSFCYRSSGYALSLLNCYSISDYSGYTNLPISFSNTYTNNKSVSGEFTNSLFFNSGTSSSYNGTALTLYYPIVDTVDASYLITAEAVATLNTSTTNSPYIQDTEGFNSYYPLFSDTYFFLKDTIVPLLNGSDSGSSGDFGTLTGQGSGYYDSETGKFEYNITVNSPDYSGVLGNPNYEGSYTIPGTADNVGVDINDMSGFDSMLEVNFDSLFLALPAISFAFTRFISGSFSLLIGFVMLLTLIAWFFGRKV